MWSCQLWGHGMKRLYLLLVLLCGHVAAMGQEVSPMGKKPSGEAVKGAKDILKQAESAPITLPMGGYALVPMLVEADAYVVPGGTDCLDQQLIAKGSIYKGFLVSKDKPGVYADTRIAVDATYNRILVRGIAPGTSTIIWHAVIDGKSVIIDGKQFVVGDPAPVPPTPPGPNPPGPNPPKPPAPLPDAGFRVLFVVESKTKKDLPSAQLQALTSKDVLDYLDSHCIKVDNQPEYRSYDPDTEMKNDSKVWQDAMARPRASVPWVLVTNGKEGFEGPLPPNKDALLKLLKEYGGN